MGGPSPALVRSLEKLLRDDFSKRDTVAAGPFRPPRRRWSSPTQRWGWMPTPRHLGLGGISFLFPGSCNRKFSGGVWEVVRDSV